MDSCDRQSTVYTDGLMASSTFPKGVHVGDTVLMLTAIKSAPLDPVETIVNATFHNRDKNGRVFLGNTTAVLPGLTFVSAVDLVDSWNEMSKKYFDTIRAETGGAAAVLDNHGILALFTQLMHHTHNMSVRQRLELDWSFAVFYYSELDRFCAMVSVRGQCHSQNPSGETTLTNTVLNETVESNTLDVVRSPNVIFSTGNLHEKFHSGVIFLLAKYALPQHVPQSLADKPPLLLEIHATSTGKMAFLKKAAHTVRRDGPKFSRFAIICLGFYNSTHPNRTRLQTGNQFIGYSAWEFYDSTLLLPNLNPAARRATLRVDRVSVRQRPYIFI